MLELTAKPALEAGSFQIDSLTIVENFDVALASIAARLGEERKCETAAKTLFGSPLPAPQELVEGSDYTVFWTGPDQYFVEAPVQTHEDIEIRLKTAFKETASITDQSGGWVRFDIDGNKTLAMFERLCMVDLATTPDARAIRTVIDHIGCFLITRPGQISLWCLRSYAGSMFHGLKVAAKSV